MRKIVLCFLLLTLAIVISTIAQDPVVPIRGKLQLINSTSSVVDGVLINTGSGITEFQDPGFAVDSTTTDSVYISIFGQQVVIPKGSSTAAFWESYVSGIKPENNLPVYLPNVIQDCKIDTFFNGIISKGTKDSLILVSTLGSYNDGMIGSTILNNDTITIGQQDDTLTSISVDQLAIVSIPISLSDYSCFQGVTIDSVKFTFHNITTDQLLIDSSNAVILFVAVEDSAIMFFDVNNGEPITFLSGTDTTVSTTIASNNYNFETASSIPIYNNTEYRLIIGLRDSTSFQFDAISVDVYIDTSELLSINLGINPYTGEIVKLPLETAVDIIQIPYENLMYLISIDSLQYPAYYLVTDTRTSWKYQYTDTDGDGSTGDEEVGQGVIEPLLVKTLDASTIDETSAKSLFFPKDIIYWSPYVLNTNDYPDTATGVIYHRTDTDRRISMNCDWRNIQQYRWNDGTGVYNIARKEDAPDTTDRELHYMITPYAKDVIIQRRGTPDVTSSYDNSNIVIKKAGTFFAYATTINGSNKLPYINLYPLYDAVQYWGKPGDFIVHPDLPGSTTIDSIANDTIYVSANATGSSAASTLISTDYANVAVNYFTSATNLTVENQFYDNRIHILLQSTFHDLFLNDGLSISLCEFDEYSHNNFNEIVLSSGTIFSKNSGTDLFSVTVTDTLRHHTFLSNVNGQAVAPSAYMQSTDASSTLFGEISGQNEPLILTNHSSITIDIPSVGEGLFLKDSTGSGTLEWANAAFEFTPASESDSNYSIGTVTYDATYFYVKVDDSPHVWNRFLKTAW